MFKGSKDFQRMQRDVSNPFGGPGNNGEEPGYARSQLEADLMKRKTSTPQRPLEKAWHHLCQRFIHH